jgi:hypothetical protein
MGKCGGTRKHREGIFFAETVEGRNRVEHFSRPCGSYCGRAFL